MSIQKKTHIIKKVIIFFLLFAFLFSSALYILFFNDVKKIKTFIDTPFEQNELKISETRAIDIYDRNNILLSRLYPKQGGKYIEAEYDHFPKNLIEATISAEDKNFFTHNGVDFYALIRAFYSNLRAGKTVSGGSTITQQLAKMLNGNKERSYKNKFKEAVYALRLEKHLSKEDIITLYLNKIFFGNNSYGVASASQTYFKKDISSINLSEAIILASIIKSGTKFNPYKKAENLNFRRQYVAKRMNENGFLSDDDYLALNSENTKIYKVNKNIFNSPHFSMYINKNIKNMNMKEIIKVNTTLDYKLEKEVFKIIKNTTSHLTKYNVKNISCVVLDAKTSEILTMIGSFDYYDAEDNGAINGATALRQPGSTLKPFLYAYIFDKGETPASVIGDVKTYINSPGGYYIPDNFDKKFRGPVTVRDALANSLNVPAVRWLYNYRISEFQNILLKSGLSSIDKSPDYYGYSIALGSAEVRLIDLASAYSIFTQKGYFLDNSSIKSIEKSDGEIIALAKKKKRKVISEESAYQINNILSDKRARLQGFPSMRGVVYPFSIAIKTGTSKGYRDAWGVGYTKDYIVAIWLGDFKGDEMMGVTGGSGVVPIIYDIFSLLNKSQKETDWQKPKTIISRDICIISGKLKSEFCNETREEIFNMKNVIDDYCNIHRLYIKTNIDNTVEEKVFMKLPKEYDLWAAERQIEMPDNNWTDTTFLNNQTMSKNTRLLMIEPKNGEIYKIDKDMPLKYQNINIKVDIPFNSVDAFVYCNGEIIGDINSIKENNIRWQLKKGDHSFYALATLENNETVKSSFVNIHVR